MISIVLVILVVFLFLRDLRATFIPSVAVPVSLVGTFGVMYLCGYSIDNLSLMALTIATGFVVDDAIVVIENITRHLEEGVPPLRGRAVRGPRKSASPSLSISVSLVAVFIPILLMGGHRRPAVPRVRRDALGGDRRLAGRLADDHADDVRRAAATQGATSGTAGCIEPARRCFDWILGRGTKRTLGWVLRHQRITLLVTLATIGFTVYLYVIVPKGFFPQQDTGRLTARFRPIRTRRFSRWSKLLDAVRRRP